MGFPPSTGGSPTGSAGGDLTGTYPNPNIGSGKVTVADLAPAVTLDAVATANATAADVAMNTHKLTSLSAGTAAGHSVRYEQVFGGATTGSLGVVLGQSGTIASHTGDLTETVLATVAIPAGFLGANGYVQVYATYTRNGSGTGAVTVRARFGASGSGITGTSIAGAPTLSTAQLSGRGYVDFANANSASSQAVAAATLFSVFTQQSGGLVACSINTANASEIDITGQLANTGDTVNLVSYLVIAYPHA